MLTFPGHRVQVSPCCLTSESSHLIHFALVVRRNRRHPICSASSCRHWAHRQSTVRLTGSLFGRAASVAAHLALREAILSDHCCECCEMICRASRSVLMCQSCHCSSGCRCGLRKSLTIHRCNMSSSSRCCLVVVHDSAPQRADVVIVAPKSFILFFNVVDLSCSACFWAQ